MPKLDLTHPQGGLRQGYARLEDLVQWDGNPREHDRAAIAESILRYGMRDPIEFDEELGKIVSGNGRATVLEEMKAAGKPAPEFVVDADGSWWVPVATGAPFRSPAEAVGYLVAANRTQQLGGWNRKALVGSLKEIEATALGLLGSGFTPVDLQVMDRRRKQSLEEMAGLSASVPGAAGEALIDSVMAETRRSASRQVAEPLKMDDPVPAEDLVQFVVMVPASKLERFAHALDGICVRERVSAEHEALQVLLDVYDAQFEDPE